MANLDYYAMTNTAISKEIGSRLKLRRLYKNLTQEQVAINTGISIGTVKNAEKGSVKLFNLLALLREYGELNVLDLFIPERGPSPLLLMKWNSKLRKKASKRR